MGALLSQIVIRLFGRGEPQEDRAEVDHDAYMCCRTMDIVETQDQKSQDEKDSQKERDGNEDVVHR